MAIEVSKRLFTVHEYHRMVDAGILSEDDRVELIRGEIIAMSPIEPRHGAAVLRATYAETGVPEYWIVNLRDDSLIVHSNPTKTGYSTVQQFQRGRTIAPKLLPQCRMLVDVVLP